LVKELPEWFSKIEKSSNNDQIKKAIQYYQIYSNYFHKNSKDLLTTLQFLVKNGNISHFEWRKDLGFDIPEVDLKLIEKYEKEEEKKNEVKEIDWSSLEDPTIEKTDIVDIKWEEIETPNDMDNGFSMDDIDLVDSGSQSQAFEIDWGDEQKKENDEKNVKLVYQMRKESLLENDESRFHFFNDILELESFFQFRISEKSKAQDLLSYMKDIPKEISNETKSDLVNHLKAIQTLIQYFNDEKFKELILIKTSEKYVQRTTNNLKQTLELIEKMSKNIVESEKKKKSLEEEIENLQPVVERIVAEIKENQDFLENQISNLLKGRKINIYGEINKI
jgi:hypothetical protein